MSKMYPSARPFDSVAENAPHQPRNVGDTISREKRGRNGLMIRNEYVREAIIDNLQIHG